MRFYYIHCNNIMTLINLWAETEIHICIYTCVSTQTYLFKSHKCISIKSFTSLIFIKEVIFLYSKKTVYVKENIQVIFVIKQRFSSRITI